MIKEALLTIALTASTCFIEQINQYDNWIDDNYKRMKTTAQRICWSHPDFEDILQTNLIKVRERIIKSGWTNTTYETYDRSIYSYLYRGIDNDYKLKKKRENRTTIFSFNPVGEDAGIQDEIEQVLQSLEHDSQSYREAVDLFVKYLFKYIELNYPAQQCTLFKTYYLSSNHNTYNKLTVKSKYSLEYITKTIRKMKKDVKTNLVKFINDDIKNRKPNLDIFQ